MSRLMVMVSGARGMVGRALVPFLVHRFGDVVGVVRDHPAAGQFAVGDIGRTTDWREALTGCDAVVHLAARVHVMDDRESRISNAYTETNTEGTLNLARQAAASGVRRFVFLSSVKVNGESTEGPPFSEKDPSNPGDPYAVSKWEAEKGLWEISKATGMEVVVLRPPLVYGPGVKGNFLKLMQLVDIGLPLPLGKVDNRRSMIYIENLLDAIGTCLSHPNAVGKTYLLSDGEALSTPQLIRDLAAGMGRRANLVPIPVVWLRWLGGVVGVSPQVERLIGSLEVDMRRIQGDLGWEPPCGVQRGLSMTASWFAGGRRVS